MKTAEEFRDDVRRKAAVKRAARRRVTALGLAAAVLLTGGVLLREPLFGVLSPGDNGAHTASPAKTEGTEALEAAPEEAGTGRLFTLQAAPKPVVDLWWTYLGDHLSEDGPDPDYDYSAFEREYTATLTEREFSRSMTAFAGDLAPLLYEGGAAENHCFSPLSLYYALALTAQGAGGETRRQLLDVLHAPDAGWLAVQCDRYYRQHYLDREGSALKLVNSLWVRQGTELKQDFLTTASENFYASAFDGDFTDPALGEAMGRWVSEHTNGLLEPRFQLDPETVLTLLNTVYFKGQWTGFDAENTTVEDFTTGMGGTVQAAYMHQTTDGYAVKGDGYTRASLGLGGAKMAFILPDEGVTVEDLLTREGCWEEMTDFFYENEGYSIVHWSVPKFDTREEPDVTPLLKRLGVTDLFDPERADLSGLTEEIPEGPLYVSEIAHGARVKIDENGVEAAAYTKVGVNASGGSIPMEEADMTLNRPFLFAILAFDSTTEGWTAGWGSDYSPLFIGVVNDPTQGE